MSTINIRGGSDGNMAEVDAGNALRTRVRSEWEIALDAGLAFSWSNATYDYSAIDTVLAIQNNSGEYDLKIKRIFITGSTATQWVVHTSKGITWTQGAQGAAIVAVNLNRGSARLATSLCSAGSDEEGNAESTAYAGRLITGRIGTAGFSEIPVDGAIILPDDHDIGIDLTTDGTTVNCTIWGYFVPRA